MYKVHAYLDQQQVVNWRMPHLPRTGETVRLSNGRFAIVTEVVWCLDEESPEGQRVNLRLALLPPRDDAAER
jgi:hypothetical protein